jgi:hypothetical protein
MGFDDLVFPWSSRTGSACRCFDRRSSLLSLLQSPTDNTLHPAKHAPSHQNKSDISSASCTQNQTHAIKIINTPPTIIYRTGELTQQSTRGPSRSSHEHQMWHNLIIDHRTLLCNIYELLTVKNNHRPKTSLTVNYTMIKIRSTATTRRSHGQLIYM